MDIDQPLSDIVDKQQEGQRRVQRVGRGGRAGRGGARGGSRGGRGVGGPRFRTPRQPRPAPYQYRRNMPEGKTIKVAATSVPKTVAGSIAHSTREGEFPAILCRGVDASNQTVKAIAIARSYLTADGFDLRAQIEFQGRDSPEATITLSRIQEHPQADIVAEELTVKKDSDPYKVAGAVAGRVREGKRVQLIGLGPDAVFRCIETLAVGRRYLSKDGMDLTFAPEFFAMQSSDGTELSALKFSVFSVQV